MAVAFVSLAGIVTFFVSLGSLIVQGLFSKPWNTPVLCSVNDLEGASCTVSLLGWHSFSLLVLFIFWRYGDKLFDKGAAIVNAFR